MKINAKTHRIHEFESHPYYLLVQRTILKTAFSEKSKLLSNLKRGEFKRYPKPSGFNNKPIDVRSLKVPKRKVKDNNEVNSTTNQGKRNGGKRDINLRKVLSNIYDVYVLKIKEDQICDQANVQRLPISRIILKHFLLEVARFIL